MDTGGRYRNHRGNCHVRVRALVTQLAFSLLDVDKGGGTTTWEDYVQVRAIGPLGVVAVYQVVDNTGNHSFAGLDRADLSADPTTTDSNLSYTFDGAVS